MCDYSLHGLENRLAKEGERLVLNKFRTGCKGFASKDDLHQLHAWRKAPAGMSLIKRGPFFFAEAWRHMAEAMDVARYDLPAVCLPHGATLQIISSPVEPRLQAGTGAVVGTTVRLIQVTHEPHRYRDAIMCLDSRWAGPLSLQNLPEGVVVEVLSLNLAAKEKARQPGAAHARAASSRR